MSPIDVQLCNYLISGRATPCYRNIQGMPFSLPDHLGGDRWLTLKVQRLGLGMQCKILQSRDGHCSSASVITHENHSWLLSITSYVLNMKVTRDAKDIYEMSLLPQNQRRNNHFILFCRVVPLTRPQDGSHRNIHYFTLHHKKIIALSFQKHRSCLSQRAGSVPVLLQTLMTFSDHSLD